MYLDAQQAYSIVQALAGPATVISTNVIDHSQDRNIGIGEPLVLVVSVAAPAVGGGTLTIVLQADTTNAFGAPVTVGTTIAIPAAQLTLGARIIIGLAADLLTARWSRVSYILATMTGISVTSWLSMEDLIQNDLYFPAGATIQ